MSEREQIQEIWRSKPNRLKQLGQWARKPARRVRRARRYRALARFAEARRDLAPRDSKRRTRWAKRRENWNDTAKKIEAKIVEAVDLVVIPRSAWGARAPRAINRMSSESNGLFIHHTVGGMPSTEEGEKAEMRGTQNFHMDTRGWNDIAYSYVVFPSGRIYEGRGRGIVGAHTEGYNSTSHAACGAGNYATYEPSDVLIKSLHWIATDFLGAALVRGHRDVNQTDCPGSKLYARLPEIR